jgi:hypothetical protein
MAGMTTHSMAVAVAPGTTIEPAARQAAGVSLEHVRSILAAHGIGPHRRRACFKGPHVEKALPDSPAMNDEVVAAARRVVLLVYPTPQPPRPNQLLARGA